MNGYGMILHTDNQIYIGEIKDGAKHGYGEFYFGMSAKRYFGFYHNDKKHGFGCFIWEVQPFQAYIGFWLNGKMNGCGCKISGNNMKYGLWKDGEKQLWLQGPWEMRKYADYEQTKYLRILEMKQGTLMKFITNMTSDD